MFGVFLKQKIANQPLTVVGSGNQKRDFTYVTDVVNAFYKGLYYSCNINILNVGTGKPISINKIVKLLNSKKVTIPKRPGEPDITNAKRLLINVLQCVLQCLAGMRAMLKSI